MSTTAEARQEPRSTADEAPVLAMIIRGEVIEDDLVEFVGRGDTLTFRAPDPHAYVRRLPASSPASLRDLYTLSFEDILDFLEELGSRLDIRTNEHLQWARDLTYATAPRTRTLIDNDYKVLGGLFGRERVRQMTDRTIGIDHLEGWVDTVLDDGTISSVRAFGARTVHIIPGNGGGGAATDTIIRSAVTRGDCIIKPPSHNPFTPVAIGRTMCEMAPDHPITRHVAIAYWRGGDTEFEQRLFQPHNVEKIVAWGGLASVKHVTRYVQPGLELISLDPKYSASVVGAAALADEAMMREAALRIAVDVGTNNQTACSAARVVYVLTGGDDDAVERVNQLGEYVYEELVALPEGLSSKPKSYDRELRSHVDTARLQDEWYKVVGGDDGEGSVIVSQLSDPVDFTALLADRTVNIVPVDSIEDVLERFDAYTQTVGVWPESVKDELIDVAPLYGVQRFVPLGYSSLHTWAGPHDGLELDRRLCKWIVNLKREPIPLTYAASRAPSDPEAWTPPTLEAVRAPDSA